jgi:hypothetical protein
MADPPRKTTPRKTAGKAVKPAAKRAQAAVIDLAKIRAQLTPPARGRKPLSPLQQDARDDLIVTMMAAGFTYHQIADAIGLTRNGAISAVRRILSARAAQFEEDREHAKVIVAARIEALIHANWQLAMAGDDKAAGVIDKMLGRYMRLYALDQGPSEINLTQVTVVESQERDRRIQSVVQSISQLAARRAQLQTTIDGQLAE